MSTIDYPLFVLAFDHRGPYFEDDLFPHLGRPEKLARAAELKGVILDGFDRARAREPRIEGSTGILVDVGAGAEIARAAAREGATVTIPVEYLPHDDFIIDTDPSLEERLAAYPNAIAKVLMYENPEGDRTRLERQMKELERAAKVIATAGRQLMIELVVPPTSSQCDGSAGSLWRYASDVRPGLTERLIDDVHRRGVTPEIWKVEGFEDREAAEQIAAAVARGGDGHVIVLGQGRDLEGACAWLRTAASVDRLDGFAIGRTIWNDAIRALVRGDLTSDTAAEKIADRYRRCIEVWHEAAS